MIRSIDGYLHNLDMDCPEPHSFVRMLRSKRASRLAPFAAMAGYEEIITETAVWRRQKAEKKG